MINYGPASEFASLIEATIFPSAYFNRDPRLTEPPSFFVLSGSSLLCFQMPNKCLLEVNAPV